VGNSVFTDSFRLLEARASVRSEIAVAFSGGKDSLCVLDMCARVFKTTRAFFFYTVPGLEVCEAPLRTARERYGIEVVQFPHWAVLNEMVNGRWRNGSRILDGTPELSLRDGYAYGMHLCEAQLCATGMKEADGLRRKQFFARTTVNPFWRDCVMHPIRAWRKRDVLDYLKAHRLTPPPMPAGCVTSGVGLDQGTALWLHDCHPEDWKKYLKWFPYAQATIYRREWHGIGRRYDIPGGVNVPALHDG
jgi:3'-phosphoadenosine 5'-phosphosulfate sulfotransferase (PAPS reductase)/FAD synthetase